MNWISVKDKMPDLSQSVLIYVPTEKEWPTINMAKLAKEDQTYNYSMQQWQPIPKWYWICSYNYYQFYIPKWETDVVTHWMVIPEPFKEKLG